MTWSEIMMLVYSAFTNCLLRLLCVFPSVRTRLAHRPTAKSIAASIIKTRSQYDNCILFFCSSAGEFEQAKPIINRLTPNILPYVLFFSESGPKFLAARGDSTPFSLTPASDATWHWGMIFAALRPSVVVIVRHELWPGFLATARAYARHVTLIDASQSIGEQTSRVARWLRRRLFRNIDQIHAVTNRDKTFFQQHYHLPESKITCSGDTKYDRVIERSRERQPKLTELRDTLISNHKLIPQARYLVIGSAYTYELKLLLAKKRLPENWQVIVVPHILDKTYISELQSEIASAGFSNALYSDLNIVKEPLFLIVDTLGMLSDLYGIADAAIVGGGLHNKVHNVIEPAAFGIPIAFGPRYHNSSEALLLIEHNLATVISKSEELHQWWQNIGGQKSDIAGFITNLTGASARLLSSWQVYLGSP